VRVSCSLGLRCRPVLVLRTALACQDNDPTAPVIPVPATPGELSGVWSLSDSTLAVTPVEQNTCRNRGLATFTAATSFTNAELRLVGTCITPRGPGGMTATMEGASVTIVGDSIAFTVAVASGLRETCTYAGRLTGGASLGARGSVSCSRRGTGTWEMSWGLPDPVPAGRFVMIDIGYGMTCALDSAGQAWCWGGNSYGHLGVSDDLPRLVPAPAAGSLRFTQISVAREGPVVCGVTGTGEAWCWGSSWGGVLGDGSGAEEGKPVSPRRVVGNHSFSQIAAAGSHTCAITTAGDAWCWGTNSLGQLGTGNLTPSSSPVAVAGNLKFRQISTYTLNTCGVTTTGSAYCWGEGWSGILGNGQKLTSNVPVPVSGGHTFASVSVGMWMACGVTTQGDGYCWGEGGRGLGTGAALSQSSVPVPVAGGMKWKSIRAGGFIACGVTVTNAGYCWGDNFSGALGAGASMRSGSDRPIAIAGSLAFDQVVIDWHGCGLTVAGIAWCWSTGEFGQIGDGNLRTRWEPVKVAGQQ
jgi:alpha-tubulin suppressor-like RCC1 family protein